MVFKPYGLPVFTIASAKGGAGKTTVAVNLAHAITLLQTPPLRPLFIDLDSQGDATSLFGVQDVPIEQSICHMMEGNATKPVEAFGVLLIGNHVRASHDMQTLNASYRFGLFQDGLIKTIREYKPDVVIIDTPPMETPAGEAGLKACTNVVVALQPHARGFAGAETVFMRLPYIEREVNRKIKISGVVPIMRSRGRAVTEVMEESAKHFGDLLTEEIPLRAVFMESALEGMPIVAYELEWKANIPADQQYKTYSKKYNEMGALFTRVSTQILRHANEQAEADMQGAGTP